MLSMVPGKPGWPSRPVESVQAPPRTQGEAAEEIPQRLRVAAYSVDGIARGTKFTSQAKESVRRTR
jgi:hypothetical protein